MKAGEKPTTINRKTLTVWSGYVMSWAMIPPPAPASPLITASDIFSGENELQFVIFWPSRDQRYKLLGEKTISDFGLIEPNQLMQSMLMALAIRKFHYPWLCCSVQESW